MYFFSPLLRIPFSPSRKARFDGGVKTAYRSSRRSCAKLYEKLRRKVVCGGNYRNYWQLHEWFINFRNWLSRSHAARTSPPQFWMAPCRNIVMNAAITGSFVVDSVIYRARTIMRIKKITPHPKNRRWFPDEYKPHCIVLLIALCTLESVLAPRI